MSKRVDIISQQTVFKKAIFEIIEARLRHEHYNGTMSDEIIRLNLNRGDSVAAIIHNVVDDTLLFTEQFRYPTYRGEGTGWLLETPAGMIDAADDDPRAAMERELVEEIGYSTQDLQHISTFFVSPGGSSERIHLFYARVQPTQQTESGGGVRSEGEDIRTVAIARKDALAKMMRGEIQDAKTLIGLQWLRMQQPREV